MTRYLVHVFYGFCVALLLVLAGGSSINAHPTRIVVGGDHAFPPYEFLENGQPAGFNIELVRAVADVMNLEIEIRLDIWSKTRQDLEQRKIDMITGMVYSLDRDKLFDYSVPHTMIFPGLFVRENSPILKFSDIKGKDIIVQKGDIIHDFLKKLSLPFRIITVADYPEALELLASGKHDGVYLPSELHKYYVASKMSFDDLRVIKTDMPPLRYCFAVAEGNRELLSILDQGLILLKSSGKYQEIYNKWFGVYEQKKWWETIKYFVYALVAIAVAFTLSLLWSWSLKRQVKLQTAELRTREEALKRAHSELEQRVRDRTVALAQANNKLKNEIIERKKIEAELRKSKEEYRAIIDAFDGQIYICSPDYKIEFMNNRLIERTGYDACGESCYKALHARDSVCPWCVNDQVMEGKTVRWEVQSPKDNRWYYIVNTPIQRNGGSISKQAMILDITERIQAELEKKRLEARNRKLQKAESLGRMAGAIAHHFNNKLHVVIGHLEVALKHLPEDLEAIRNLREATQAADQAAEVSRLMLTYLGKVTGKQSPQDLSAICQNSMEQIQLSLTENITLETDYSSPGPVIQANLNQIQLILINLISNSREAIGTNQGVVYLRVRTVSPDSISFTQRFPVNWKPMETPYCCLEVQDSGCGMAAKDIEEAFDPFFSTKFTGRGLGLSVVLGLVQAHHGAITVESTPGKGSTFRLFFPITAEQLPGQSSDDTTASADFKDGGTVLLVDDDRIVLTITEEMLSMLGYEVLTAMDGGEAIQIFQKQEDEILFVLSDFAMPHMNGLEMLAALRQIKPSIPVILASGYSEEEIMASNHPERPNIFLGKPFGVQELKDAILRILT